MGASDHRDASASELSCWARIRQNQLPCWTICCYQPETQPSSLFDNRTMVVYAVYRGEIGISSSRQGTCPSGVQVLSPTKNWPCCSACIGGTAKCDGSCNCVCHPTPSDMQAQCTAPAPTPNPAASPSPSRTLSPTAAPAAHARSRHHRRHQVRHHRDTHLARYYRNADPPRYL
jgi:hypothetical protein